jgi:hypothetical protein
VLYKGGAENFGANLAYLTIMCVVGALVPANNHRLISYFLPEDNRNRKRPRARSSGSSSGLSTTGSDNGHSLLYEAEIDEGVVAALPRNVRTAYRENVKKLNRLNDELERAEMNLRDAKGETQTAHDRRRRAVVGLNAKWEKCTLQLRHYEKLALRNTSDTTDKMTTVTMHFRGDKAIESRDAAVISAVDKLSSVLSTAFNAVAGTRRSASPAKDPATTATSTTSSANRNIPHNNRAASRGKVSGSRANTPTPIAPSKPDTPNHTNDNLDTSARTSRPNSYARRAASAKNENLENPAAGFL